MQTPPPEQVQSNYPRPNTSVDRQVLREVAISQRQVLLCVLGQITIGVLNVIAMAGQIPILYMVDMVLALALLVFMILSVIRLSKAMALLPVIYAVLMFIPCVSLIVLFLLSGKATALLTQAGIKVGFLGADPKSV